MAHATPPARPPARTLDVRGYLCPIPATKAEAAIAQLAPGEILQIIGDDPVMTIDIPAWCHDKGHRLIACERRGPEVHCLATREP